MYETVLDLAHLVDALLGQLAHGPHQTFIAAEHLGRVHHVAQAQVPGLQILAQVMVA